MSIVNKLKDTYAVEQKCTAFYTGGDVAWTEDTILCQNYDVIKVVNIESGTVTDTIGTSTDDDDNEDTITSFTLDNDNLVVSHKSGLLKLWTLTPEIRLIKLWRSVHKGPIAKLAIHNQKLASGGSDGTIRLWNLTQQTCLQSLKNAEGVISVLKFNKGVIYGAGDNNIIYGWNQETGELKVTLTGHFSQISDMDFQGQFLVSCSRDKVLILWDLKTGRSIKVLPLFEGLESIRFVGEDEVAVAGESGIVRLWDVVKGKEKRQIQTLAKGITKMEITGDKVKLVSQDHNLLIYGLKSGKCRKQLIGFSDEVLDICYVGEGEEYIAVATNSPDIKLYEISTMNCELLKGHNDIVLSLSSFKNLMVSSSKDHSVRLWMLEKGKMRLVNTGNRHTAAVLAVTLSSNFIVSVSEDKTIKLWNLELENNATEVAHSKDINGVTVSPNEKLIATCSQDKSIKIWSEKLEAVVTFKGHKRGVWSVRFSPVDQVLASSSADCTIKLWSLTEFTCLKTFEGHDASVLRVEFLTSGLQLITAGGDGLIKLWSLKTSECQQTLDEHSGRIWALIVSKDESKLITGGSDSQLTIFKDVTAELRLEEQEKQMEIIKNEQILANLLQSKQLLKALRMALKLQRPGQVLKIVQQITKSGESSQLGDLIAKLGDEDKELLLSTAVAWNSNSKFCHSAQVVLNVLLKQLLAGDFRPNGLRNTVEGLLPYTERHFRRATKHLEDLYYLKYTIDCMEAFN